MQDNGLIELTRKTIPNLESNFNAHAIETQIINVVKAREVLLYGTKGEVFEMKYKKKLAYLQNRILFWEKAGAAYQRAHTRPGSVKVR